jgi:moderate conductance mechanosensitive channel
MAHHALLGSLVAGLQPLVSLATATTPPGETVTVGPLTFSRTHWGLLSRGASVAMTLAVAVALLRAIPALERFVTRFASKHATSRDATVSTIDAEQRLATLTKVTSSIAQAVIWTTTIIVVLGDLGIAVGPLLATAGIAGVAVGFGAQTIVKDFFSGFFILLENQFDVGDTITVNTVTGIVERMTLRITVLRDAAGTAYFFPNSNVVNVANRSYGWVRAALDAPFSPAIAVTDVHAALDAVIRRVNDDPELRKVLVEPARAEGPVSLAEGAVTWRLAARARPGFADEVKAATILALSDQINTRGGKLTGNVIG